MWRLFQNRKSIALTGRVLKRSELVVYADDEDDDLLVLQILILVSRISMKTSMTLSLPDSSIFIGIGFGGLEKKSVQVVSFNCFSFREVDHSECRRE